jgi:hypothetical protein
MVWPEDVQVQFRRMVQSGDEEGAAALLGQQSADMQMRYGLSEAGINFMRSGMRGRLAMSFGSFSHQYGAYMLEALGNTGVPMGERMAMAARYAAVTGAVVGAEAYTGWNFGKWMWHKSLTFAGGPPLQLLMSAWNTVTGAMTESSGGFLSDEQKIATRRLEENMGPNLVPSLIEGISTPLFPWRSGVTLAGKVGQAAQSTYPGQTLARTLITGENPNRVQKEQAELGRLQFEQGIDHNFQGFAPVLTPGPVPGRPMNLDNPTTSEEAEARSVMEQLRQSRTGMGSQ